MGSIRHAHLLNLPDLILAAIARKMGTRARLVCSKLCQVYGPPGAVLCPPAPAPCDCSSHIAMHLTPCESIIKAWRHTAAVRRLVVSDLVLLDASACRTVAGALPNLRVLECGRIDPTHEDTGAVAGIATHAALTSLHAASAPNDVRRVVAFAPSLRRLRIDQFDGQNSVLSASDLWGALASLRGLQSLQLPVHAQHLSPPDSLSAALSALTRLTHLGLDLNSNVAAAAAVPAEHTQRLVQALAALPHLASVRLGGFRRLGSPLGPALQALRLASLHLHDGCCHDDDAAPPGLAGCLPALSAMPLLRHLAVSGGRIAGSHELLRMLGTGSPALNALEMHEVHADQLEAVCDVLACIRLPALTRLSLRFDDGHKQGAFAQWHGGHLAAGLMRLRRLQQLEVHSAMRAFLTYLESLPALTSLGLSFHGRGGGVFQPDLGVIGTLTGLRRLVLSGNRIPPHLRAPWWRAVGQLPLLEELSFHHDGWSNQELLAVVSPWRLRRLALLTGWASPEVSDSLDAVKQLMSRGVYVSMP
jgi:hypothetical protein